MATCSQCQMPLTVPRDMIGKWVRCPACHESFLAHESSARTPLDPAAIMPAKPLAALSPPAAEPVPFDSSNTLQQVSSTLDRREREQRWERVRSGLRTMYSGLAIGGGSFLAVVLVNIVHIVVVDLFGPRMVANPPPFMPTLEFVDLAAYGFLAGTGLGALIYLVGTCVCMTTPAPRTGLWLVAQPMFLFLLTGLSLNVFSSEHVLEYAVPLLIFSLGAILCLAVFLRRLAEFLGSQFVMESAPLYGVFHVAWLPAVCYLFGQAMEQAWVFRAALRVQLDPPFGELLAWLLLLAAVGVGGGVFALRWTLRLLRTTWEAIDPAELGMR